MINDEPTRGTSRIVTCPRCGSDTCPEAIVETFRRWLSDGVGPEAFEKLKVRWAAEGTPVVYREH